MSIISENAKADPSYCPYCMRCAGLVRMVKVEPLLWRCGCGAIHDEREPVPAPSSQPPGTQYAQRDIEDQAEYYMRHLDAMTREGLHSKSDIAAELAHRDRVIDRIVGIVQMIQPAGSPPPYGPAMFVEWIVRAAAVEIERLGNLEWKFPHKLDVEPDGSLWQHDDAGLRKCTREQVVAWLNRFGELERAALASPGAADAPLDVCENDTMSL